MFCNPLVSWSKDCNFWFKGTLAEKSALFCLSQGKHPPNSSQMASFPAVCVHIYTFTYSPWLEISFLSQHMCGCSTAVLDSGGTGEGAGTMEMWHRWCGLILQWSAFSLCYPGKFLGTSHNGSQSFPMRKMTSWSWAEVLFASVLPSVGMEKVIETCPYQSCLAPKRAISKTFPRPAGLCVHVFNNVINNVKWHVLCGGSKESPVLTGKNSSSSAMHKAERPWRRLLELPLCIHQEGECLLILGN